VLSSLVYLTLCRLFALVVLLCRSERSKELEILVLRHELAILRRQARQPQHRLVDRILLAALSRSLPRNAWGALIRSSLQIDRILGFGPRLSLCTPRGEPHGRSFRQETRPGRSRLCARARVRTHLTT